MAPNRPPRAENRHHRRRFGEPAARPQTRPTAVTGGSSKTQSPSCSTPLSAIPTVYWASGEYRIEDLARLAGTTHPQPSGSTATRWLCCASHRFGSGRIRAVQRHAPDPAAADHLDARPRIQHRARPGDAQRLGGGQRSRRCAGPGNGDRRYLDHREVQDHAVGRGANDSSTTSRLSTVWSNCR